MSESSEASDSKSTEAQVTLEEKAGQETDRKTGQKAGQGVKMALDFVPLVIFFATFKFGGIFVATGVFMVAMVIAMFLSHRLLGHVAPMQKFTFVVVMVMGGLTIYLQDERFVKMKLTIINGVMASILIFGLVRGKYYIKIMLGSALEMDDIGWRTFSRNFIVFLLIMAVLNEFIWRTQSTDFWVNFKTFGYIGLMMVFFVTQAPLLAKYMPDPDKE